MAISAHAGEQQERSTYIIRGGAPARERLRALAAATGPGTRALLDGIGIPHGARILDVGCGAGDVTLELAERAGPCGEVVGVDLDRELLGIAAAEAVDAGRRVTYRLADATSGDLGHGYDVVYARFLLAHVPDPRGLVERLHGAAAPGGLVIVEDIDHTECVCYPESPAFERFRELYEGTARRRGADPRVGGRLAPLLRDAGVTDISLSATQPFGLRPDGAEGAVKRLMAMTMEAIAPAAVAEGLADPAEVAALVETLHGLAADDTTAVGMPRVVQAWGRRPAG